MISDRQWISICLAGLCWWGGLAVAQETGGTSGGSGNSAGGSATSGGESGGTDASGQPSSGTKSGTKGTDSTSGTTSDGKPADPTTPDGKPATPGGPGGATPPKTGGSVDPFIPTTPKTGNDGPGASSAFGTPPEKRDDPMAPPTEGETAAGSSSAFGPGDSTATQQAPPSFTLPGFFGSGGATTYTGGQGRLARPRFRYRVTVSQGYDDNPLQTPDDPQKFPDQQVLVDPGTPDTVTFVPVTTTRYEQAFAGPIIYYRPVTTTTYRRVVTKGRDPVFQTVRAPEPQERKGSAVTRLGLRFDTQKVTRRSLFTMDLGGSTDYYWDRPGRDGNLDYSGSVALAYLYNLTPRLQASLTANIAYISQPDFTRINTPDRLGAGDLVNALARLNVMYRVTPRFSTTVSVGQNAIIYVDKNSTSVGASDDSYETTISAEARYLWKPRYTLLAEFRHVLINYPDSESLNSHTEVLLVGADMKLSSRVSATLRLGESVRIFDDSGETSSSPYGEATVLYRISPTSSLQWVSRFGYEEPPGVGAEALSYRTTLNYFKNFTPRLSLSAGITGVSRNVSFPGAEDESQQIVDANIALEYHLTRQLTLNTNFSFTKTISNTGDLDYDRSRIFIGAEYEF